MAGDGRAGQGKESKKRSMCVFPVPHNEYIYDASQTYTMKKENSPSLKKSQTGLETTGASTKFQSLVR